MIILNLSKILKWIPITEARSIGANLIAKIK